jgi:hypothetical protein
MSRRAESNLIRQRLAIRYIIEIHGSAMIGSFLKAQANDQRFKDYCKSHKVKMQDAARRMEQLYHTESAALHHTTAEFPVKSTDVWGSNPPTRLAANYLARDILADNDVVAVVIPLDAQTLRALGMNQAARGAEKRFKVTSTWRQLTQGVHLRELYEAQRASLMTVSATEVRTFAASFNPELDDFVDSAVKLLRGPLLETLKEFAHSGGHHKYLPVQSGDILGHFKPLKVCYNYLFKYYP